MEQRPTANPTFDFRENHNMDAPPAESLLLSIEQLQDQVLCGLDELNNRLELTLREFQANLKLFRPTAETPA